MSTPSSDDLADRLARNIRALREARNATQAELAKLAGLPRATWGNLESGAGNPTLVLYSVAQALQVSLEELLAAPRASARHYPAAALTTKQRGSVSVRKLLPDPLPGMEFDRMELPPGSRMIGIPHTPGTREYLVCESGALVLVASGERYELLRRAAHPRAGLSHGSSQRSRDGLSLGSKLRSARTPPVRRTNAATPGIGTELTTPLAPSTPVDDTVSW